MSDEKTYQLTGETADKLKDMLGSVPSKAGAVVPNNNQRRIDVLLIETWDSTYHLGTATIYALDALTGLEAISDVGAVKVYGLQSDLRVGQYCTGIKYGYDADGNPSYIVENNKILWLVPQTKVGAYYTGKIVDVSNTISYTASNAINIYPQFSGGLFDLGYPYPGEHTSGITYYAFGAGVCQSFISGDGSCTIYYTKMAPVYNTADECSSGVAAG